MTGLATLCCCELCIPFVIKVGGAESKEGARVADLDETEDAGVHVCPEMLVKGVISSFHRRRDRLLQLAWCRR